jgi:hypothetical protein
LKGSKGSYNHYPLSFGGFSNDGRRLKSSISLSVSSFSTITVNVCTACPGCSILYFTGLSDPFLNLVSNRATHSGQRNCPSYPYPISMKSGRGMSFSQCKHGSCTFSMSSIIPMLNTHKQINVRPTGEGNCCNLAELPYCNKQSNDFCSNTSGTLLDYGLSHLFSFFHTRSVSSFIKATLFAITQKSEIRTTHKAISNPDKPCHPISLWNISPALKKSWHIRNVPDNPTIAKRKKSNQANILRITSRRYSVRASSGNYENDITKSR